MKKTDRRYEVIESARRQLDGLEWLFRQTGVSEDDWDIVLSEEDDSDDGFSIACTLTKKTNVVIELLPVERVDEATKYHFYIDGNHSYDEFAVEQMKLALEPEEDEEP